MKIHDLDEAVELGSKEKREIVGGYSWNDLREDGLSLLDGMAFSDHPDAPAAPNGRINMGEVVSSTKSGAIKGMSSRRPA